LGIQDSGFEGFQDSRYSRIPGSEDSRNFRILGFQGFRISGFRIPGFRY